MIKVMSFIVAITLLFQSFNFGFNDFQKIPALVNHLSFHLNDGDSLSSFISKHYGSITQSHEKEHSEHKELPFKHQHLDSHYQLAFVLCVHKYPFEHIECKYNTKNFNYKEPLTTLVIRNFFQPPKLS